VIFISCTVERCAFVARILVEDDQEADQLVGPSSDWYPDRYPCPLCGERCVFSTKCLKEGGNIRDLSVREAFIAFNGVGLPGEHECSASRVQQLLTEHRVTEATTRHISGTPRCVLSKITLENGIVLHLGSSVHGAVVYRISEPSSYVAQE
jgi:hypothetical protein